MDKEEQLVDVKYVIFTHFLHSPEENLMAETSWGKSAFLPAESLQIEKNDFSSLITL